MAQFEKMTYADASRKRHFAWQGDAYIDVFADGEWYPIKSINVWDYQAEKPVIEPTQAAFEAKCREWLDTKTAPQPDANGNMTLGAYPPMRDNN